MLTIQDLVLIEMPAPEDVLPFYQQAVTTSDRALLAEVDRICAEYFAIDAEDLLGFCE